MNKMSCSSVTPLLFVALCGALSSSTSFANDRFQPNGDGTVFDSKNSVTWMRCSAGQSWNGSGCDKLPAIYSLEEAKNHAKNAPNGPWRLPTLIELQSLVHCNSGKKGPPRSLSLSFHGLSELPGVCEENYGVSTVATKVFPNAGQATYWSSERHIKLSTYWGVSFGNGGTGMVDERSSNHLLLVK